MSEARTLDPDAVEAARSVDVAEVARGYGFSPIGGRWTPRGENIGACPGCGGRDRFSINTKENVWSCRQGGSAPIGGDAIELVRHVENCSFPRAVELIAGRAFKPREVPKADPAEVNAFREKERRRAYDLIRATVPFPVNGVVAGYLSRRGIEPDLARLPGARCRQHDALKFWHPHDTGERDANGRAIVRFRVIHQGPAMVWPITGVDGHFLGLHATWIDPETFAKADIFDPETGEQLNAKKVRGSVKGGRIILRTDERGRVPTAVGEGIESTLSWAILRDRFDGMNLHASVTLGNLAGRAERSIAHPTDKITRSDGRIMPKRMPGPDPKAGEDQALLYVPDPESTSLILLGDGDSDPHVTRAAMMRAKTRLVRPGFNVAIDWPSPDHDFNSMLTERLSA